MSYTAGRQIIQCDGRGCASEARTPVALRPSAEHTRAVDGWLFVQEGKDGGDNWSHYCPRCVRAYLDTTHTTHFVSDQTLAPAAAAAS
jgi:hypothetical protein